VVWDEEGDGVNLRNFRSQLIEIIQVSNFVRVSERLRTKVSQVCTVPFPAGTRGYGRKFRKFAPSPSPPVGSPAMAESVLFRMFRGFNDDELQWAARSPFRLNRKLAHHFKGGPLAERIISTLADRAAISVKETLESFETYSRVRRRLRAPQMADLCCGHGLTGLLFAAFERSVEEVVLLNNPKSLKADVLIAAVVEAAPWVESKVRWVEQDVERAAEILEPHTSIVAVHACGVRTDRVLEAAVAIEGNVAVLPCCYAQTAKSAPRCLRAGLGVELATDVHRTYWLEERGYDTDWAAIPEAITPMNRILIGIRRDEDREGE